MKFTRPKFTRRELAGAIASAAAVSLAAQIEAPAQTVDYLAASRVSHRENSDVLRKFDLAMSTQPAFAFKA